MPVCYSIDAGSRLIRTTGTGQVTLDEVLRHFDELAADPQAEGLLDVLLDLTECSSLPTSEQLRSVAARIGQLGGRLRFGRCAIVADRDALFGMIRMFAVFVEDLFGAVHVVRTRAEAEVWLGGQ